MLTFKCQKKVCNWIFGQLRLKSASNALQSLTDCNNIICIADIAPRCGSDGVTYHGSCDLARAACETGKKIEVVSWGECPKLEKS